MPSTERRTKGGQGFAKLPPLATLDWPPPPSPAAASKAASATSLQRLGAIDAAGMERETSQSRPTEIRARAELWALREEIEREKLRVVPPYPFFGRAMRFQDESAALQIAEDGRFSYSTLSHEAPDAEAPAQGGESAPRRRVTYEGFFVVANSQGGLDENSVAQSESEVGSIEGHAILRHEIEDPGGKLISVERGDFSFAIKVSPYYQPLEASVQLLIKSRTPGRPKPRHKQLPYVGAGGPFGSPQLRGEVSEHHQSLRLHARKILKSTAHVQSALSLPEHAPRPTALPKLLNSNSAPQFASIRHSREKNTATDWKEFYKTRAKQVLESAER